MGLFKKKQVNTIQFSDYSNKNKGTRKSGGLLTSFDRLQYFTVANSSQEQLMEMCDIILGGKAILANFDQINSEEANFMLSFISGVVYATQGEIFKLDNKLFLFGRKEEFEDGSLHQYVEDSR